MELAEHDVIGSIDFWPSTTSLGPDRVPTILLKNCRGLFAKIIAFLWQQSLREGAVPESLKFGTVTAVFKGGDKSSPKTTAPSPKAFDKVSHVILLEKL